MAYMSQEKKKEIQVALKKALGTDAKKRGFLYSLGVRNHSTLVMKIRKGTIDFMGDYTAQNLDKKPEYLDVRSHSVQDNFKGKSKEALTKIVACMHEGNHDNSDIMTDYFDVGWYVSIEIGEWNKPYVLEA